MRTSLTIFLFCQVIGLCFSQEVDLIVYPGDTGNDSIVSARDLLPIGVAYNRETIPREPAQVNWAPQPAVGLNLNTLQVTGINIAHVDANGDGLVDSLDSEIIVLNYDSLVQLPLPPPYQPIEPLPEQFYCPFIRLEFSDEMATIRDTVLLDIFIEGLPFTGVPEPQGVLGVSFSLNYDPLNVKDSLIRIFPDTAAADLMFVHATANLAGFGRSIPEGRIDFAAAGYGINAIQQPRRLGRVSIIVEDMILRSNVEVPFSVEVDPSSVLMVNRDEFFFQIDCEHENAIVILTDADQPLPNERIWQLYPNPSMGELRIEGEQRIDQLQIFNILGQDVYALKNPPLATGIFLAELPPGNYWVQLYGNGQRQTIKWQIF